MPETSRTLSSLTPPTRAIIDLSAARHNCQCIRNRAPSSQLMAIIKANAYGHGAVAMAEALVGLADGFGVARIIEAIELRRAGITAPILVLEGVFSQDEYQAALQYDLWLMVENQQQLDWVAANPPTGAVKVWLKMDTGMHRLGFAPDQYPHAYQQAAAALGAAAVVNTSHLACADEQSDSKTSQQLAAFRRALDNPSATSIANSAGIMRWPDSHGDWVRPGIMLYGIAPFATSDASVPELQPVMSFESQVIALRNIAPGETVGYGAIWQAERESIIATVAVGYADGYPRTAPFGTPVLINGHRAPVVGRVSMDMLGVDVTNIVAQHGPLELGAPVELWGKNLDVREVAEHIGTIAYELVAALSPRVERVYVGKED